MSNFKDIIPTIDEDAEIEDFSEESDIEVDYQPSQRKNKANIDFDSNFEFVGSVEEYNKDIWNDLKKYVKRKAKSKTDDKIKKIRSQNNKNEDENVSDSTDQDSDKDEDLISDDELKKDKIKIKEKKKKKKINQEEFFEDAPVSQDNVTFYQMGLSRPLLKAITDMQFVYPTPIQASTIPVALLGRDICGCAKTGTGKTAAYMLPTLERLLYKPTGANVTRVLVLVPTRELGVQVYQVTKQICQYTEVQIGLAVGGLDLKTQESILRKSPDIVIATPGRLIDHLKSTPTFCLNFIEVLILDEADRMLDEFFAEQMKEIIKQCSRTRQTMLFSATMTDAIEDLAAVSLVKPVRIFVDGNKNVALNLRQEFIRIREDKEADREAILSSLLCRTFRENCIIFVKTKKQAHRLHIMLGLLGLKISELHGNLTQPQRIEALQKFKNKEVDFLIATDVAARGLDIQGIQTVVNYELPSTLEQYIHRVGRTARAGRAGIAVSLAGEQERKVVKDVIKQADIPVKSRVIPPDIVEKYKQKLEKLEPQIVQILREEEEERQLAKAENQANKAEKILKGENKEDRPWFQTKKQRKQEKEKLTNINKINQKKKKKVDPQEEKMKEELSKTAKLQAKMFKTKHKPKKINSLNDTPLKENGRGSGTKRKSHFGDLTDVSTKSAKKMRYEANVKNRGKFNNKNNKKLGGKVNKHVKGKKK